MNKKAAIEKSTEIIIAILLGIVVVLLYLTFVYSPGRLEGMISGVFSDLDKLVLG